MANQNKVIVLRHAQCHALVFQLTLTKTIKLTAESVDNSSSEGSESSDYDEVSSSELSTSSESSSEEQSCSQGKGKGSARTAKTSKGNASSAQSAPSRKKRKVEDKLNAEEMEELTYWIFSSEQAVEVAMQLRSTLLRDSRVKGELERFAKELLSDAQKQHFQLLLSGFCRKFSTLAQESYKSSIPTYRKVAFSVAWMKFLSNFHPGKSTQE